jgi:hypothetical protein
VAAELHGVDGDHLVVARTSAITSSRFPAESGPINEHLRRIGIRIEIDRHQLPASLTSLTAPIFSNIIQQHPTTRENRWGTHRTR